MNYHFIGIGGISLRALAEYAKIKGNNVTGSDISDSAFFYLNKKGIKTFKKSNLEAVKNADIIVYSSAIKEDDIELKYAKSLNKKCLERSEYLNEISKKFNKSIFIAGSHGKSTTTSIIARSLYKMGYGLIGHCGAEYIDLESNLIYTGDEYLISEACEYKKNFLKLNADIAVILNIDYDHPDSYQNEVELVDAFIEFAKNSKQIICEEKVARILKNNNIKCTSFGVNKNCDYSYEIIASKEDFYIIGIYFKTIKIDQLKIYTIQEFNLINFLAAYVTIASLKKQTISQKIQLCNEILIKRRMQKIGQIKHAKVYLDYAHHPKEIALNYKEIKSKFNKVLVVFEAHTFSRTRALFSEFISAFCCMDNLILLPTYPAREVAVIDPIYDVVKYLDKSKVKMVRSYIECAELIKNYSENFDAILILGAGDIYTICNLIDMDKTVSNELEI